MTIDKKKKSANREDEEEDEEVATLEIYRTLQCTKQKLKSWEFWKKIDHIKSHKQTGSNHSC